MPDPLSSSTPKTSNSLLNLNVNMNLNPETTEYDDMHNMKYMQPDTLCEPVPFQPLKQNRVNHVMFAVATFVEFRPYSKSFNSLERYIR